jgi:hypothetical protein
MVDRQQIVNELENRGQQDLAKQAQTKLPEKVNIKDYSSQLQQMGIDPQEMASKFLQGGGPQMPSV